MKRETWLILGIVAVMLAARGRSVVSGVNEVAVQKLAEAIAWAEGFFVAGSRPARNHNPGNLTGEIADFGAVVHPVGEDAGFMVYRNDADGWEELRNQLRLALSGQSAFYGPQMSLWDFAHRWTTTDRAAWAATVAARLGVSTGTRLADIG